MLINASGPFQAQSYGLARACIRAGCHYIDLADARAFVTGITQLDREARAAGVSVISGASSVPGLSSAVIEAYAGELATLDAVDIGISPGNSFDPGLATTASILGAVGKPYGVLSGGGQQTVYGWQGLRRHRFPQIGARWMSNVEVPDLDLLPARYPGLKTARFSAGVEVGMFHLALWGLSWLVRAGVLRDPGSSPRHCSAPSGGCGFSAAIRAACSSRSTAATRKASRARSNGRSSHALAMAPTCRR